MVDIKVPALGESVTEAMVAQWLKKPGDAVSRDEPIVELETDKVTLEVNAPTDGVLETVAANEGDTVEVNALLGVIADGDASAATNGAAAPAPSPAPAPGPAAAEGTTPTADGPSVEVTIPSLGESVTEATIGQWLKKAGEAVARDEPIVELETEKATMEVNAPQAGVLSELKAQEGDTVEIGALIALIVAGGGAAAAPAAPAPAPVASTSDDGAVAIMPAAAKMIADHGLDASAIKGTGKGGRILKEDVQAAIDRGGEAKPPAPAPAPAPAAPAPAVAAPPLASGGGAAIEIPAYERPESPPRPQKDREERVRMSKLRQTIARRLKEAQNTAAMLTTFNEVDMSALMAMRAQYKDRFEKRHGVRIGFMSFFVKAAVSALQELPAVNAEIDGTDMVYKNYYDIGVAVGSPQGLVVPVVRDCDRLSFAEIEKGIGDYARKARDGKLTMAEMTGGTFTITNGGVYGSLMSTPILNPPQSAILAMHKIQERPMAVNGKVEIRPMMYLALSYDHRIIDGKEAVTFLVRIKEAIEDPGRLLIGV